MNRTHASLFLVFAVTVAAVAPALAAEELDLEAEAKQAAKEAADQAAERATGVRGKYQRKFYGTFKRLSDAPESGSAQVSPEVVGTYSTNAADTKPGRNYLVKVENGNKAIIDALKRMEGKKIEIIGILRNIDADGEAKYVIASEVTETGATPPPVERRKFGGL
jgi:plasmid stabilization system protein ParE